MRFFDLGIFDKPMLTSIVKFVSGVKFQQISQQLFATTIVTNNSQVETQWGKILTFCVDILSSVNALKIGHGLW
jgi:hypothetical protein